MPDGRREAKVTKNKTQSLFSNGSQSYLEESEVKANKQLRCPAEEPAATSATAATETANGDTLRV